MSTSTVDSLFLSKVLEDLRDGKLQLPDFQRGWVWDDEHIRSLLASIASTYPVGAVMMLETGGEANFQPRPVQGVEFSPGKVPKPERLILDGQQRLTSLFQATLLGKVVATKNSKKQEVKRWYYADMRRASDPSAEMDDAIIGIPESRVVTRVGLMEPTLDLSTPTKEFEECMFPMSSVFEYADWQAAFMEHWKYAADKTQLCNAFGKRFVMAFAKYLIPAIVLRRETPKVAVCQVFEKVNTGGVSLNAFELLTATYAADNFSLRDDWLGSKAKPDGRRKALHADPVLRGVQETDFLQAITLLHTLDLRDRHAIDGKPSTEPPAVSCKRVAILNLPLAAYQQWSGPVTQGFLRAAKFVRQNHMYAARDLPYQTQLIPLAAALTRLGSKADVAGYRQKLAKWMWCGVFGELYGGAIESRFAFDVQDLVAWLTSDEEPRSVQEALFDPNRLFTLRTRNSAAYKGVYALLMKDGGADFLTGDPITAASYGGDGIDIHHIFPQRWCIQAGIEKSRFDCIVNKTALSSRTNRIIGGVAPSAYLAAMQKKGGLPAAKLDEALRTHALEPQALRSDDFDAFFSHRTSALLERISSAMGKPLASGGSQLEPFTYAEDDSDENATSAAFGSEPAHA